MSAKYERLPTSDRDHSSSSSRAHSPAPPYHYEPYSPTADNAESFEHFRPLPSYNETTSAQTLERDQPSSSEDAAEGHGLLGRPGAGDDAEHTTFFSTNPRTRETRECIRAFHADPRFHPTPPSPYARMALILVTIALFYFAFLWRRAIWVDFGAGMGGGGVLEENGQANY